MKSFLVGLSSFAAGLIVGSIASRGGKDSSKKATPVDIQSDIGAFGSGAECVYLISDSAEDEEFPGGLDYFDVIDETEELFRLVGIRTASYEEPLYACILPEGQVVGALYAGRSSSEMGETVRFSVAVNPDARRQRVATRLVQAMVDYYRDTPIQRLEAWVVNPHMADLLEKMGFDTFGGGEWSQHKPHMEMWL